MIPANKQPNHARHRVGLVLALVGLISAATLATGPLRPASAQTVGWSVTGKLNTPRYNHTATLLPDGTVLVVGGFSAGVLLPSAELYDPSTGAWSFTGSLKVPRMGHTATLLGNGKVLVAGGFANGCCALSDLTKTAELYDPATGEWSLTGDLNFLRTGHTATLLSNGEVLSTGGALWGAISETNTAELYDPATGKWSLTGKLSETRYAHTMTLLQGGQVLVAAGAGPFSLNTAELYNPATARWSYTGSLLISRGQETVTLLPSGQALVVGGQKRGGKILKTAELYDPATGKWNTTASLNTARSAHTATLLFDGKVLVVGGREGTFGQLRSAELYDSEILDPAPTAPRIIMASVSGKKLFITGENFHAGAVILLNDEEQKSKNDEQNPQTMLIGKKTGKKVKAGDQIQVRNPDGTLSEVFIFTGS